MKYIAIIDYQRLDNGMFMKSFSEAMGRQRGCSGIILHGDSEYTERLIQTGMLREDAVLRSTRDLNHRIVALLADSGVAGIGINGYQRRIVGVTDEDITLDRSWLESRPAGTHIVLSNLAWDHVHERVVPVSLTALADALACQLDYNAVIVFSLDDNANSVIINQSSKKHAGTDPAAAIANLIPDGIVILPENCYLSTTEAFGKLPDTSGLTLIS
jgi:hypothetical protein